MVAVKECAQGRTADIVNNPFFTSLCETYFLGKLLIKHHGSFSLPLIAQSSSNLVANNYHQVPVTSPKLFSVAIWRYHMKLPHCTIKARNKSIVLIITLILRIGSAHLFALILKTIYRMKHYTIWYKIKISLPVHILSDLYQIYLYITCYSVAIMWLIEKRDIDCSTRRVCSLSTGHS